MSRLDHPAIVVGKLQEAVRALGAAHAAATESEGGRTNLTGPVSDAIFGLNTAVDSLAQMIEETTQHVHSWRTEGDGEYEPFVSKCEDCGAVDG